MTKILVAVDGSSHSASVVDFAAGLAEKMTAGVVLTCVIPEVSIPDEYREFARDERIKPETYYEEVSRRVLIDMARRLEKRNVKSEQVPGTGNPTSFILDVAQSKKADLIVVGVHGLHRLGRIRTLGSVARRIIENSRVPVVAVP